jgi:hypothetical protein
MGRATDHLLCYHDDGLDGELPVAVVEKILQAGAEEVDDQDVVEALLSEVVHIGDAGCSRVSLCLAVERGLGDGCEGAAGPGPCQLASPAEVRRATHHMRARQRKGGYSRHPTRIL